MKKIKPENAPWVSAYLMVKDIDKSIDFYVKGFGFKLRERAVDDKGTAVHAELTYHDQLIMLGQEGAWCGTSSSPSSSGIESPMSLYIYTENVDQFYQHALANGAEGRKAPEDTFWGDRMCSVNDLNGYNWCFATTVS